MIFKLDKLFVKFKKIYVPGPTTAFIFSILIFAIFVSVPINSIKQIFRESQIFMTSLVALTVETVLLSNHTDHFYKNMLCIVY